MKIYAILIMIFFSLGVIGQEQFIVKNVTLFDGEQVRKGVSVLVKNDKIETVTDKSLKLDKEVKVIDGKGKTLLPALTNSHVHAWSAESLNEAAKAGVLNLLDMHGVEMMQGMMRNLKDSINYANYFAAGSAATAPDGHGTQYGFPTPTLTKPEEAEKFVSDRLKAGADYIKIIVEPWKKTLDHETVKALIAATHKQDKIAVVHISKVEDAFKVLDNNADGLVHIWWDKKLPEDQLKHLAKNKDFFVIPTLLTSIKVLENIRKSNPDGELLSDDSLKSEVKRLYDAGVPILAGTDPPNAQINYGTDLYKELLLISEAGVPNIDVLKSATSLPAQKFGFANQGFIKKGYLANMILVTGNPLDSIQDIDKIEYVWKNGKQVQQN